MVEKAQSRDTQSYKNEFWECLDLFLGSFLICKGHHPEFVKQGRIIVLRFTSSSQLFQDLETYSAGETISASRFAQTVKQTKATVLSLKGNGNGGHYGQKSIPR